MKTRHLLITVIAFGLLTGFAKDKTAEELKVNTALSGDEQIVFALVHEWENPKNKDICLNGNDIKALRNILAVGIELKDPKGAHTLYPLHRYMLKYWVYKAGSGTLESHSIGITKDFALLWHVFPEKEKRKLRALLKSKGVVLPRNSSRG